MSVSHIDILVEERSMEAALHVLLPKILHGLSYTVHAYDCKSDLLKKLPARLRGYASWSPPGLRIVILVDRDADDCRELKQKLEKMALMAQLGTKSSRNKGSTASGPDYIVVNRIVVEELEAWYFGDWNAVVAAYPRTSKTVPQKAGYRDSDAIKGGTWEAFERILKNADYFKSGLRKIEAARAVATHMDPARNTSRSFNVFRAALIEMCDT